MNEISDNLLAAFLEGNASAEDSVRVLEAARKDPELREIIDLSFKMDEEDYLEKFNILPLSALAAEESNHRCAVMSELYVLKLNGVERSLSDWETQAFRQGWLKDGGTPMHNIGRLLEQECFSISRTFHNSIADLRNALEKGNVIVVVDAKELTEDSDAISRENLENEIEGPNPNHAVVVQKVGDEKVEFYDPAVDAVRSIEIERFNEAWKDSSRYMVKVSRRDFNNYEPHPLDLSDVELPEELTELREAIAENAHEVWALGRKNLGWTYGPERNDTLKQTPDMVPYSDLTEEEKSFDREMAINTIKLLKKLGYKIYKE